MSMLADTDERRCYTRNYSSSCPACRAKQRLKLQQLPRIAFEDRRLLGLRNLERLHGRDRVPQQIAALLEVERRVRGEQALRGAEEGVAAACRRDLAERRIGIEHLV